MKIECRPNARISRSALDEVKSIQTLLSDVYKDAGDGRTLLRELVQNADDAKSSKLNFIILEHGLSHCKNSLLRGSSLVVINNGPFTEKDHEAIHQAIGGSKVEEADKVGRFGVGLKSIFHICEAIIYIGAGDDSLRPGVINPWAGTDGKSDSDPIHPDWDFIPENPDMEKLLKLARYIANDFSSGLFLWIPIRTKDHLDRSDDGRPSGIIDSCPSTVDLFNWFASPQSLAYLLAQCGYLDEIRVYHAKEPDELDAQKPFLKIFRDPFQECSWVGRYDRDESQQCTREFQGTIQAANKNHTNTWKVTGIERLGEETLIKMRNGEDWPRDHHWIDGRNKLLPRKALSHAAISVIRPKESLGNYTGLRFRWGVFLPLDDAPRPDSGDLIIPAGDQINYNQVWDIILHGYFWPSHDRKSIPGVTDVDSTNVDEPNIRIIWNQSVRDLLLFPLFPKIFELILETLPQQEAKIFIEDVKKTTIFSKKNLSKITKYQYLLPVISGDVVNWKTVDSGKCSILSIPDWIKAPQGFKSSFIEYVHNVRNDDFWIIDKKLPRLGGYESPWPFDWQQRVLSSVPNDTFNTPDGLEWLENLIKHLIDSSSSHQDNQPSPIAEIIDWLSDKIANDALKFTRTSTSPDDREEFRIRWRSLFELFPHNWIFFVPLEAQLAVRSIADERLLGPRFIPVPLGTNYDNYPKLDAQKATKSLKFIGSKIQNSDNMSNRMQISFLMLSQSILYNIGTHLIDDELIKLPLIRATKFPGEKNYSWSVSDLKSKHQEFRIFAKPSDIQDQEDDSDGDQERDFKKKIRLLSDGTGEDLWLVDSNIGTLLNLPVSRHEEMLNKILSVEILSSRPKERLGLLKYLKNFYNEDVDSAVSSKLIKSIKHLIVGRNLTENDNRCALYYINKNDHYRNSHEKTLTLLLRLLRQKWRAVDPELVGPLPNDLTDEIGGILQVDNGVLYSLAQECFDNEVDWEQLEHDDIIHLLKSLHSTSEEEKELWRKIPLHKLYDNSRGRFDSDFLIFEGNINLPTKLNCRERLLFPDQEIRGLYHDVSPLDKDQVIRLMLEHAEPHVFAHEILDAFSSGNGRFFIQNNTVKDLLKSSKWLPLKNGQAGTAPENVIFIESSELMNNLIPLARDGGLGSYFLHDEIDSPFHEHVHSILSSLHSYSRSHNIRKLAQAIKSVSLSTVLGGKYCLPAIDYEDMLEEVLQSPLSNSHRSWMVVAYAAEYLGSRELSNLDETSKKSIFALAESLSGTVLDNEQISMLNTLAEIRPTKNSSEGKVFRKLISIFSLYEFFNERVLPYIKLPTQDGQWNTPDRISRSESGISKSHKLISEIRQALRIMVKDIVASEEPIDSSGSSRRGTVDTLRSYFDDWHKKVPRDAIGSFLCLLGDGNNDDLYKLAQEMLGEDIDVDAVRDKLGHSSGREKADDIRVWVSGKIAQGHRVRTLNLLGCEVDMEAGQDHETIFASDPLCKSSAHGDWWEIRLRDVDPHSKTPHELLYILRQTVEWWTVNVLQLDYEQVKNWWSEWGEGSQAQIAPVKASIDAHLPLTLQQLDVKSCPDLYEAMLKAQKAQRRREQAAPDNREAINSERNALKDLASLIKNNAEHQAFVWKRVQAMMKRYGYSEDSVLVELTQNADDALSQSREISQGQLSHDVREIQIKVTSNHNGDCIDFIHFGRPINDTGGASFPQGKERQWDQDLYYMMLLNLSSKPGDLPGSNTVEKTTGQYGLGFKSVHFVSEKPTVISGFLYFSIAAGLIPEEIAVDSESIPANFHGHQPTVIRLPLRQDMESSKLVESIFKRFKYASILIPVFAREIRKIAISGSGIGYDGIYSFDSKNSDNLPGWNLSEEMNIPGLGLASLLRFRPFQAEESNASTEAIAIAIKDGLPAKLPLDVPFIWNVTPTSEAWGCGYAINGPVKLDPGRTHVSLDDEATIKSLDKLGRAFGKGLVDLHDIMAEGETECHLASSMASGDIFLSNLWTVLTSGLDTNDKLRKTFLLYLHGQGKGLSRWITERSVVPTSLHYPFAEKLPPINKNLKLRIAASELKDIKLCQAMAKIRGVNEVIQEYDVISESNFGLLKILINEINTTPSRLSFIDIFKEALDKWNWQIDPEALHSLSGLADEELYRKLRDIWLPENNWIKEIKAKSREGAYSGLRKLLLPSVIETDLGSLHEDDLEDELLRSKFAPSNYILDPDYISSEKDIKIFRLLRAGHGIGAEALAEWYHHLSADKYRFGLDYLLRGKLAKEVLKRLRGNDRPSWLRSHDQVLELLADTNAEDWEKRQLLTVLFPGNYQQITPEPSPIQVNKNFLKRMQEWWDNENTRQEVIDEYEKHAWPGWLRNEGIKHGLENDSKDHWMALLILGACRSIGRTQRTHHRNFLKFLHEYGWWETFVTPASVEDWTKWMEALKEWQDGSSGTIERLRWMSLFPSIFMINRHLKKYRSLLTSSSRRPEDLFNLPFLLAPRVDPSLTGAGINFDAPPAPVNFGLHWILRELYRMEIIKGDHIAPYCWVPSSRLIEFLRRRIGMFVDDNSDHQVKAENIHDFIKSKMNGDNMTFHRTFDIPFLYIIRNPELQSRFGLEDNI